MPKIGWGTPRTNTIRTISESSHSDSLRADSEMSAAGRKSPARPLKIVERKDSLKMFSDAALLGRYHISSVIIRSFFSFQNNPKKSRSVL